MSSLMPVLVIILALIAAGSIAYIAWELSSEKFHDSLGRRPKDGDDDA
jgi:hypothetical protein